MKNKEEMKSATRNTFTSLISVLLSSLMHLLIALTTLKLLLWFFSSRLSLPLFSFRSFFSHSYSLSPAEALSLFQLSLSPLFLVLLSLFPVFHSILRSFFFYSLSRGSHIALWSSSSPTVSPSLSLSNSCSFSVSYFPSFSSFLVLARPLFLSHSLFSVLAPSHVLKLLSSLSHPPVLSLFSISHSPCFFDSFFLSLCFSHDVLLSLSFPYSFLRSLSLKLQTSLDFSLVQLYLSHTHPRVPTSRPPSGPLSLPSQAPFSLYYSRIDPSSSQRTHFLRE